MPKNEFKGLIIPIQHTTPNITIQVAIQESP